MNFLEALETNKTKRVRNTRHNTGVWYGVGIMQNCNFDVSEITAEWEVEEAPQVVEFEFDGNQALPWHFPIYKLNGKRWKIIATEIK